MAQDSVSPRKKALIVALPYSRDRGICRSTRLPLHFSSAVYKLDPDFLDKLRFLGILIEQLAGTKPAIPDLDQLGSLYGRLNDYLHAPKRPEEAVENIDWWHRLEQLLSESVGVLGNLHSNEAGYIKLNEKGWSSFDKWKQGELSDEDVIRVFQESEVQNRSENGPTSRTLRS